MERSYPAAFLGVFALVTVGALVAATSLSGAAFSTYNTAWDGTSELRSLAQESGANVDVVRDVSDYRTTDPNGTVVFVIAPESTYTDEEAATIRSFVEAGGTVVVAGSFGPDANGLLADLAVASTLDGALVRDERHYDAGPSLPRATNVSDHPYTREVDALTLNHGTVIRMDGSNATALVNTSGFAYLDANGNDQLDDSETLETYTVVSRERVGRGHVVVASDPSIFINAMLDREGNRQFARNLVDEHDRVAIDVSHASGLPPTAWAVLTVRDSTVLQLLGGIGLVAFVAGRHRLADRGRAVLDQVTSPTPDPPSVGREELIESLARRYPHWDDERLRRVAQTLIHPEKNSKTDE